MEIWTVVHRIIFPQRHAFNLIKDDKRLRTMRITHLNQQYCRRANGLNVDDVLYRNRKTNRRIETVPGWIVRSSSHPNRSTVQRKYSVLIEDRPSHNPFKSHHPPCVWTNRKQCARDLWTLWLCSAVMMMSCQATLPHCGELWEQTVIIIRITEPANQPAAGQYNYLYVVDPVNKARKHLHSGKYV